MDINGKNIVWLTIDSVRADRTTPGGYNRNTTPNLADIVSSENGAWFKNCISQTRWSPASIASMFTGAYLSTHQVGISSPDVQKLPNSFDTMPELLSEDGYSTFGLSENTFLSSRTGLDRGFDKFSFPLMKNLPTAVGIRSMLKYAGNIQQYGPGFTTDPRKHNRTYMLTSTAKRWVRDAAEEEAPFFLYFHMNNTHYPYTPPKPFLKPLAKEIGIPAETIIQYSLDIFDDVYELVANDLPLSNDQWNAINAAYDAEIAYADHLAGELIRYIKSETTNDTIFIITADHGETFGEHGWLGHHTVISEELLHVPMVVEGLDGINHQQANLVQHIDITRTLLESLGIESTQFEGVNLTEETRSYALSQRAPRHSDKKKLIDRNESYDISKHHWEALNVIRDSRFKLLTDGELTELYELPDEENNVIDEYPDHGSELRKELNDRLPEFAIEESGEKADLDDLHDRLENMGYI